MRDLEKKRQIILYVLLSIVLMILFFLEKLNFFSPINLYIYKHFSQKFYFFWSLISFSFNLIMANIYIILLILFDLYTIKKLSLSSLKLILSFIFGITLTYILKNIFQVPRPVSVYKNISDYSFPSGHSVRATLFAYFLSQKANKIKIIFWLYAILVGISRIVLSAHWFSDIIVGLSLGIWISLSIDLIEKILIKIIHLLSLDKIICAK